MLNYVIRRLLLVPLLLVGVTMLIFAMLSVLSPVERAAIFILHNREDLGDGADQVVDREIALQRLALGHDLQGALALVAEEFVGIRRKWLSFLPKESLLLGSLTWAVLRAVAPVSFWALPQTLNRLHIAWPKLQNHFFRLRPSS